jgi:hypothetical protein
MTEKTINLETLSQEGRNLLSINEPAKAHFAFVRWCDKVANWIDLHFPNTGYSADWSGQPMSRLVINNHYYDTPEARIHFNQVVATRLKWLGDLGRILREQSDAENPDTPESDAVFAEIARLVEASLLPQQFKRIICGDIAEAQDSYHAAAYKACVVMLGAALEGLMLGILQRSDVISHMAVSSNVPGPIKRIGSRDPLLAEKIGNELSFEDYKVCIHDLVPGSEALGVDSIQDFRNAIHPWKSIQEPLRYGSFDRSRALHYVASLHKIVQSLYDWMPVSFDD